MKINEEGNPQPFNRRGFLRRIFGAAAAVAFVGTQTLQTTPAKAFRRRVTLNSRRLKEVLRIRERALSFFQRKKRTRHTANRDFRQYGAAFAYSKGLAKDTFSEPNPAEFRVFRRELLRGRRNRFLGRVSAGAKGLKNPEGAHLIALYGKDSSQYRMPPSPAVGSLEFASEMAELYWLALARDIPFSEYWSDSLISDAAADLSVNFPAFKGPKDFGSVTPGTIFRSTIPGRLTGPFISQLLFLDVISGRQSFDQRITTTEAGSDWMTRTDFFRFRQEGNRDGNEHRFHDEKRYITSGRDLAAYVWDDKTYFPYLNAFFILQSLGVPYNSGNPYRAGDSTAGFVSGDYPHFIAQIAEVSLFALKAAWYQKWLVHLRLRPEEAAGRIHFHKIGAKDYSFLHPSLLQSEVLERIFDYNGSIDSSRYPGNSASYLLPIAYPEGSPTHPSYPSGHATVAGACVTLLKAFFDESYVFPNPVVPNFEGSELQSYSGSDAAQLTVGGELNKLGANIAEGRNFAGIHYRTDMEEGLKLGEDVAIDYLKNANLCFQAERFSFQFTRFNGEQIRISTRA